MSPQTPCIVKGLWRHRPRQFIEYSPKIVIAPDKFRGSLTAVEVALAMRRGVEMVLPNAETVLLSLADGGEQTAEILTAATNGFFQEITAHDPLFRPIKARYGLSKNQDTAFIEMATISGLYLLEKSEQNPLKTTTLGTGELLLRALEKGVQKVVICIGGSATNDAGIGMAHALGYRFLDKNKNELLPIGENLIHIVEIEDENVTPLLKNVEITVACDVTNPLYGPNGAAYIFSPQKGADADMVQQLDAGLQNFAKIVHKKYNLDLQNIAGAGAAGGLGGGCVAFLGATLRSGIETVMQAVGFDEALEGTRLILTGEGKMDEQTLSGKVVRGVAEKAQKRNILCIGLCGTLDLNPQQINDLGLDFAVSVLNCPMTLAEAIEDASKLVEETTANVVRLLQKSGGLSF